ncbi:MAG: hypothetical protein ACK5IC_08510 [Moheibacter sp.]
MGRIYILIAWFLFISSNGKSQNIDSIFLVVKLDTLSQTLEVKQELTLVNHSPKTLTEAYFHAWANAYSGKLTVLNKVKLEDRKGNLHFSERSQRGSVGNFLFNDATGHLLSYEIQQREFIRIQLDKPWKKGESIKVKAEYTVHIPFDHVTKYGRSDFGDYLLKYFFLQPATVNEKGNWVLQHYKDFEEVAAYPSHYQLKMDYPIGYTMYSDLENKEDYWTARNLEHFRIYLTQDSTKGHSYYDKRSNLKVDFGYSFDEVEIPIIDSLLSSQILFLESYLGKLPTDKLFISAKTKKEQNYFGVDDVDAWILKLKLFTDTEKNALKLIQTLSYEYIDRLFAVDKIEDHWLKNGLQTYLMMKYVDQTYPELKLTGHLPDNAKFLGIKPLKFFHVTKLQMNDRYKLLYLYLARQNYDQPINTPYDELSNMNQFAMSGFKTGLTFYYIDQYLGGNTFTEMLQNFSKHHRGDLVSQLDVQNYIIENSPKDLSWFFDDYINEKDKINFKIVKAKPSADSLMLKIKNQTQFPGPFQVVASKGSIPLQEQWFVSSDKKTEIQFPKGDYDKIELNPGYLFPEFNDRDNYIRTTGLFKNGKKLQFKLYSDIENPEYSQIFMNPQVRWNNYDKFLLGIKFHNQSLLTRPFKWAVSPKFSTGTGKLTGSTYVQNTFMPESNLFRSITIGGGGKYEHYDKNLSYTKWYTSLGISFAKKARQTLSHGLLFSYDNLDKEVRAGEMKTDEDKYSLWNLSYYYSKPDYINESFGAITFQTTETFQKIFGEFYYRLRYAPKKQIGLRLYAGIFMSNDANTDYFNFGVSKVSDYAFNFNLLGRSESSGVLSQQYVLAEAGFKSNFDFTVNNWLVSSNVEIPVWKMIDVYADAGFYQNKSKSTEFIYDTGIRLKLIPDFIEFYLPVQSSLGFEPTLDKYWERVRFTFQFNLGSIINHLRRGWY